MSAGNNGNNGNNDVKKTVPPPIAAAPDATRQASYRSISRMTVTARSSSSGSSSTTSGNSTTTRDASQIYRGFMPSRDGGVALAGLQMAAAAPVSGKNQVQQQLRDGMMMSAQSPNAVAIKVAAAAASSNVVPAQEKVCAREYPVPDFPLARTNVTIKDPSQLDSCLRVVCKSLDGVLKPAKGSVRARMSNSTDVKVCAYRDTKTGKIVLEFNRLDGCAFTFQKAFVKAKLDAVNYLDGVDQSLLEAELLAIEKKLSFWYGNAGNEALAALATGAPLAIGKATAV